MEFITVRDLRLRPAEVWGKLAQEHEIVLTSNGRPLAILAGVGENDVEEMMIALRRARAQAAVSRLRRTAATHGTNKLSMAEIEAEIAEVRKARHSAMAKE
jgi:antitoxin (DNA-binding transcriptional repressor) of toxin-antitoxin stability system